MLVDGMQSVTVWVSIRGGGLEMRGRVKGTEEGCDGYLS